MNKNALDKLVKELGMQVELAPILESTGGYGRFEKAIEGILAYYEKHKFPILRKLTCRRGFLEERFYSPNCSPTALNSFRKYLGMGGENCKTPTLNELAKERGVSRERVRQQIKPIFSVLAKHKKDIWYNSL